MSARIAYVTFGKGQIGWEPLQTMAHIQAQPTVGKDAVECATPEELQNCINLHEAKIVHFYATYMPQRAVTVEKAQEKKLFARWFNWYPRHA